MSRGTAEITLEEYDELMKLKENNVSYDVFLEVKKELNTIHSYYYKKMNLSILREKQSNKNMVAECSLLELLKLRKKCRKEVIK